MSGIDIDLQRQFYNRLWQPFEFAGRLNLMRCTAILEGIVTTKLKEPQILDLGCGSGWLTAILGVFGPTVGVELSDEAVKVASARYPHVHFIQADILNWDYPRGRFDIVVSQEVIEHVEDQQAYLEIAYGLLREGGYLILTTPNAKTFYAMPEQQRRSWSHQPIENWLTISELKALLARRFEIIRLTTLIPGFGRKGMYQFVSSPRLRSVIERVGFGRVFDEFRLTFGYGLHSFAIARKALPSAY